MTQPSISYKRQRFLREVEEMMLERGIDVSYEKVRRWTRMFGPLIARNLRCRQARPGDI